MKSLEGRLTPYLWQLTFILFGTSWLWASLLNHQLSYRASLISQFEAPGQPYAWLFRLADVAAAGLLLAVIFRTVRGKKFTLSIWLLTIIALSLLLDPLISTTCHVNGPLCVEYRSVNYFIHIIDSTITGLAIFALSAYDYALRKKLLSLSFMAIQLIYAVAFIMQFANGGHYNTATQYIYELSIILWLAWYVREVLWQPAKIMSVRIKTFSKNFVAIWAFLNGFIAIIASLAHIHLLGRINAIYFAGDSAWLAQHGVIVGIVMIYLSRHLARGERRARQLFLAIIAIEALKYSVIAPNAVLLALYVSTFCLLFITYQSFDRGAINLTWSIRLKDVLFFVSSILVAVAAVFLLLDLNHHRIQVAYRAIDNFFDYSLNNKVPHNRIASALFAEAGSAFILAGAGTVLWILFRPQRLPKVARSTGDYPVRGYLEAYSNSSEDYFKLWPTGKDYFYSDGIKGFIAYKVVGPVAFALADPIAESEPKRQKLLAEFINMCKGKSLRACFLPIEESKLPLYKKAGLNEMQIGAVALIDVEKFLQVTARDKWWRWKTNRALKAGYEYGQSQPPNSPQLVNQMQKVSDAWLGHGGRKEYGFALGHFDSDYLAQTPISYLRNQAGNLVAFTNQLPQFRPGNVTTIELFRYTPEVDDAMPYLLMKSIEQVKAEGKYKYFDLGFVPFAKAKGPILKIAHTLSTGRFSSKGLEQFKNKFDPDWQPIYMAYDGDLGDLALVAVHLERAMKLF